MAETLNIYQKLAKVRKVVEVVQKNASGYGYKYVTDDELLARITGVMDKQGLSLIPSIVPDTFTVEPYTYTKLKKGEEEIVNEIIVKSEMEFVWVNNDNPDEKISVRWALTGQQSDASQSFGSGLTYAYRYFLLKYFGVATPNDDPDKWRSKQREAEAAEDKALAEKIVEIIDHEIKEYIADGGKPGDIKDFAMKYVKDGNYFNIRESGIAAKMLEDFKNTFRKEGK